MKRVALVLLAACGGSSKPVDPGGAVLTAAPPSRPPVAAVKVVTDTMHGVAVADPYRWLEDATADVKAWTAGQNAHSRTILDASPERDKLRAELTAIYKAPTTYYYSFQVAAGRLFAMRKEPTKEQSELIVLDGPDSLAGLKLILDPTARGGALQAIDWFVPSPDGKRVAVSLSSGGSEKGDLHIVDLDGKDVEPVIPNVQRATGLGDAAWTPNGKGFYYTRYPSAGEKPEEERDFWIQLYFHELGTPIASDRYELGKGAPKIAEFLLEVDALGRVICSIQNGDGGTFQHHLRDTRGVWRQLTDWTDQIAFVGFSHHPNDLWLISRKDAPRGKILRLPFAAKSLAEAKVVVPEGKDALISDFYSGQGVADTGENLYASYQTGGPSEMRVFTRVGGPRTPPGLPPVSATSNPVPWKDGVIVGAAGYTRPWTWYRFSGKTGELTKLEALTANVPVDLSSFEVERQFATSKDGTQVPLNIVWPKGAPRDGSVPCLATGYGGYAISLAPYYLVEMAPLLMRGVCIVVANLRGGGEFGEAWHHAGRLTAKQNVFDDFAAVLAFLVEKKYTARERLAIIGGSNGGLLMGAILTQHPELVNAVIAEVGIQDMVRSELSANGEYNKVEFGTVKDPTQFAAIHAYSPYHHVTPRAYPATLMVTGDNDARVESWHSRKMTAALQAAQTGSAPILLRTSATAGHGMGTSTSEMIEQATDVQAFVLAQIAPRR